MPSPTIEPLKRRSLMGAELHPGGVSFRVWATDHEAVQLVIAGRQPLPMQRQPQGYFELFVADLGAGARYGFRLSADERIYPDPASRFQPDGPHAMSEVIDSSSFAWSDHDWRGIEPPAHVIYEMHIGTFSRSGDWAGATAELPRLAALGVTCLEVMPVAEFDGNFGWGYDGVNWFAPSHLYGRPDDFRRFVNEAHRIGLAVILDVVYNHLGPSGNYLPAFSKSYLTSKHRNDWGDGINYDDDDSPRVREFVLANVRYWITEFHLDGYRFDATQCIVDQSPVHILADIARAARDAAGERRILLIAENEPQHTRIVRPPSTGGYGLDALWNDDWHHSAIVALTGNTEAYYTDYRGSPQEFVSAAKYGYLYQGQYYRWQKQRRGTVTKGLLPTSMVHFLQNHDQIANTGLGLRLTRLTSPGELRAMTALLLLGPQIPLLFQGQEFGSTTPFHYFADHGGELGAAIQKGRAREVAQFPSVATVEMQAVLPDPLDPQTVERCRLDAEQRFQPPHRELYQLHLDLLRLRREDPVLAAASRSPSLDGAVLGPRAFVLRFFGDHDDDRLLIVNLGITLSMGVLPEPLLAPPAQRRWRILWSSEWPQYGGNGTPALETEEEGWSIPPRCAVLLKPAPLADSVASRRLAGAHDDHRPDASKPAKEAR
jgi:maltooligosyltrehalose trehalohydrolase